MKTSTIKIYTCDLCHNIFTDIDECKRHEAAHFGLTLTNDEFDEWQRLLTACKEAEKSISDCRNPITEAAFINATNRLDDFLAAHGA